MISQFKLDNTDILSESTHQQIPLQMEDKFAAMANILSENGALEEQGFDWGQLGQGLLKTAANINPVGQLYNHANNLYTGGKNMAAGQSFSDAASDFGNKTLDDLQGNLDVVGMIPAAGVIPDAVNVGISGIRGATASNKETANKHYGNMALSSAAAIPGAGLAAGGVKIAKNIIKPIKVAKYGGKVGKYGYKNQKGPTDYGNTSGIATDAMNWMKSKV